MQCFRAVLGHMQEVQQDKAIHGHLPQVRGIWVAQAASVAKAFQI